MQQTRRELPLAVAAIARVGRALVGAGGLAELCHDALAEIADALELEAAAMYLPDPGETGVLRRFAGWTRDPDTVAAAETVALGEDEWQFLVTTSEPLVLRTRGAWMMTNPFRPAADGWLVLPLVADSSIMGIVVGSAPVPLALDLVTAATLRSIAALLSAGVATSVLRTELQRTEVQRERMRLAAELHDGLAQDLALAVRELAFLDSDPSEAAARASRDRLRVAITEAHRVVRAGLEDLSGRHPVAGLQVAVSEVCERFRGRGLAVNLTVGPVSNPIPATAVAVVLRVLHEALANVQRHSGVDSADVVVTADGDLTLIVDDSGRGFDPDAVPPPGAGHFGLGIMRERALAAGGQLSVLASPGGGARVALAIPRERYDERRGGNDVDDSASARAGRV